MLEQLLEEIAHGNNRNIAKLAARLNTSPEMVAALLEHLSRLGILEKLECCAQGCEGCALIHQCGSTKRGNSLWEYQVKG